MPTLVRVSVAALVATLATVPSTLGSARTTPVVVTGARPNAEVPVRLVDFRDLNLSRAKDQHALVSRVKYAAKMVCSDSGWDDGDMNASIGFNRCQAVTMAETRPQMEAALQRARDRPPLSGPC